MELEGFRASCKKEPRSGLKELPLSNFYPHLTALVSYFLLSFMLSISIPIETCGRNKKPYFKLGFTALSADENLCPIDGIITGERAPPGDCSNRRFFKIAYGKIGSIGCCSTDPKLIPLKFTDAGKRADLWLYLPFL